MIEAILCGGKSQKIAMMQRMNPTVIILTLYRRVTEAWQDLRKLQAESCGKRWNSPAWSARIQREYTRKYCRNDCFEEAFFLSLFFRLSAVFFIHSPKNFFFGGFTRNSLDNHRLSLEFQINLECENLPVHKRNQNLVKVKVIVQIAVFER